MDQQTKDLINKEIENNDVCLFMKGTPDAPQCGFSMAVSNILKILEVNFNGVNVLENQQLREGIKLKKPNYLINQFEYLFGEDQARYIIEIEKENFDKIKEILNKSAIHYDVLGILTESDIFIDSKSKVTIDELIASNTNWLTNYMSK